ncbi:unnamed protein product [marine sediment metagenome]|uniref:Uncharacterized protein n=1 Tax=marine sediment metagenome TaxID=412755 RepID=X1SIL6_9ZZZZ
MVATVTMANTVMYNAYSEALAKVEKARIIPPTFRAVYPPYLIQYSSKTINPK